MGGGAIVLEGDGRWIGPAHNSVPTLAGGQYLFCAGYDADNLAARLNLDLDADVALSY